MQNEQDNDIQGHINFRIIKRICACDTVAAKPATQDQTNFSFAW